MDYNFINDILEEGLTISELKHRRGREGVREIETSEVCIYYTFTIDERILYPIYMSPDVPMPLLTPCRNGLCSDIYTDARTSERGYGAVSNRHITSDYFCAHHREFYNYITNNYLRVQDVGNKLYRLHAGYDRIEPLPIGAVDTVFYRTDEVNNLYIELSFSQGLGVRLSFEEWNAAPSTWNGWRVSFMLGGMEMLPFPSTFLNTVFLYLTYSGFYVFVDRLGREVR